MIARQRKQIPIRIMATLPAVIPANAVALNNSMAFALMYSIAFIDDLGLQDITFVCQDWGGPITGAYTALALACRRLVDAGKLSALPLRDSVAAISVAVLLVQRSASGATWMVVGVGTVIEPNDPQWALLNQTAKRARSEPKAWLAMRRTYGELGAHAGFADAFERWLSMLWRDGSEAAIDRYCAGSGG